MLGRASLLARQGAIGSRGFASAAAQEVKLPVQLFGLSARYANALFVAASKAGELDKVEKDLATISGWQSSSPKFVEYVNNPVISRMDKAKDMVALSKGMAESTRGFLAVMAENGRLPELTSVIGTFNTLMGAKRGVVEATITAAESLTSKQQKAIEKAITSGYLEKGQSLNVTSKVDPSIVGGLQIQIGDKFLDLSVQSQINSIQKALN